MNKADVEALATQLISDLIDILKEAEHRRTRRDESPINKLAWGNLTVHACETLRYVSQRSNVSLTPKTEQLIADSLGACYRDAKSAKSNGSLAPELMRPEVITSYRLASIQASWRHIAVKCAETLIDQATAPTKQTSNHKDEEKTKKLTVKEQPKHD